MTPPRIAVVGMACRYPDADGPCQLWQTVLGQRRAFRRMPATRLSPAYLGGRDDPDRTYVTHAGVLRDWEFDRERFGVPGRTYRSTDQTHWLALETAADALTDAGFPNGDGLPRDEVGVLIGNSLTGEFSRTSLLRLRWPFFAGTARSALAAAGIADPEAATVLAELERALRQPFPAPDDELLAGALANTIAGRICNHFDFHGTGYTVDGACASSLLAVVQAARAVAAGELRFALAGGVDLSLDPLELVGFARLGALGTDRMRVYDASPTGFLPGEGCGVLLLTTADHAHQLGLRVYAELVGWGMSSDGAGGLTRPIPAGQARALDRAYRMADLHPATAQLVEGHGTGTVVGDRVELEALRSARGVGGPRAALGSIKANIGHTKAAAGVAGLIKCVLAVHRGVLPPTTGCETPHELLRRSDTPLRTLTEPEPWPAGRRVASVSATGFGGLNVHAVVRGAGGRGPISLSPADRRWACRPSRPDIVLLAAADRRELTARLIEVAELAPKLSCAELHDLAGTAYRVGRSAPARCALVADRPEELGPAAVAAGLRLSEVDDPLIVDGAAGFVLASGATPRIGLLFPGQAAPVRGLLPRWAADLDVPAWPDGVRITDGDTGTANAQPAVLRQSLAGLAWLDALRCEASAAVGHSLGELAALVWADAVVAADGLRLATVRGRLMAEHGTPGTTMAALATGAEHAERLLAGTGVVLAGYNAPDQVTVAGPDAGIATVLDRATAAGVSAARLPVSHGFHSAAMRAVRQPLRAELDRIRFATPHRRVISTITGQPVTGADDLTELLVEQLTRPVRFAAAVNALADECALLIEVGPGSTLAGLAAATRPDTPVLSMDCGGDPRAHAMVTAALVAAGAADPRAWFAGRAHRTLWLGTPLRFLTNPCETVEAATASTAAPPAPVPAGRPAGAGEPGPRPAAPGGGDDPLLALRTRLSEVCELPLGSITPDSSLLRDLHLSSLQLLTIVVDVAAALGRRPPGIPATLVEATVGQAAELLAAAEPGDDAPALGVRHWVRAFEHRWVAGLPPDAGAGPGPVRWQVLAPAGHWLHGELGSDPGGRPGLAVLLAAGDGPAQVAAALRRIGELRPERLLIVHHGHPAAAAVGRSASAELAGCATTVIELPDRGLLEPAHLAAAGHRELRYRPDGAVQRLTTRVHPLTGTAAPPIGPGEVCLVTGGVRGITAHTAAALAECTGCVPVLLGRSAEHEVADALAELPARCGARYLRCDVTDPDAVRATLAVAGGYGPVRGLLHGAALNEPRPLAEVDEWSLRRMLRPKVDGLRNLLGEAGAGLRFVVGYGSVIGRQGFPGESEYCVANEWMRDLLTGWAAGHPACRTRYLEWSLFSGLGMGARMGVVDAMAGQGVEPLTPDDGARALLAVLGTTGTPVTLMLSGRFPVSATLAATGSGPPPLTRFLEELRACTPGVELVADATLSTGTDPYLDEHRVGGVRLLPAVLGLEAMAQAAAAVGGDRDGWSFEDVELRAPVTVEPPGTRTVRVAALADGDRIETVLRDDSDGFGTDRFAATLRPAPPPPGPVTLPVPPAPRPAPHPYYGPLMFHEGRFRRLIGYRRLSAFAVEAWLDATGTADWFSPFHGRRLWLGDPGLLDASIHVLLACVPHRLALPVGAGRLTVWRRADGVVHVRASEVSHTRDEYLFTVDVADPQGRAVARWERLRLRATGPRGWSTPMPVDLVGPLVSRRLIECGVADRVELSVEADGAGGVEVAARADHPVGLAWWLSGTSPVSDSDPLVRALADKTGEPPADCAARAHCVREALTRLGRPGSEPLHIEAVTGECVVLGPAEPVRVACLRVATDLAETPVVLAVAVDPVAVEG